jgi:hypothetical protein
MIDEPYLVTGQAPRSFAPVDDKSSSTLASRLRSGIESLF